MLTVIVLWLIAVAWLVANGIYAEKPSLQYGRRRTLVAWMFVGGCAGAAAGLAAPALSLPGAILGAVAAGLVVRSLVPVREPDAASPSTIT
ncbi:hypothetical protein [uncultured Variovorax sp.]|uniref:hypothetical protein n=1 Tax=uncultured Variovorax sp. TaxID=114708 RepID=UPI0025E9B5D9|nr:hypothetical protein [uncultured Variovorax sp.]